MAQDFELRVRWPHRVVNVHVEVEPDIGDDFGLGPLSSGDEDVRDSFFPIDASALDSRDALIAFLKEATRYEGNAEVQMLLREPDVPTFLRFLGVTGPVSEPISVDVV